MRTLITGATGVIGGHLARALLARGEHVRILARPTSDPSKLAALGAEVVTGVIERAADVRRAVEGVNRIYHFAGVFRTAGHPDTYYHEINVGGVENVLAAAQRYGVERTIHGSTIGIHGDVVEIPCTENSPANPGDVYQRTKLLGERAAMNAFAHGLPGVVVRPSSVYGPGDTRFLKLFRTIQNGTFRMIGDGRTLLHPVYLDDLIDGLIRCGEREEALGEVFILAGPRYLPLSELVTLIASAVGVRPPRGNLPVWPFLAAGAACEAICRPLGLEPPLHRRRVHFFTKNRAFSIHKARRLLGYSPQIDVAEGVARTAQWYMRVGLLRPVKTAADGRPGGHDARLEGTEHDPARDPRRATTPYAAQGAGD